MSDMKLDSTDRKLLNLVQAEFPLTKKPYEDLGQRLGITGEEVIGRIAQLKATGFIRLISPVLDVRSLGYQSTLLAMKVAETRLDKAAQLIIKHPGVSHGYERDHPFNLWFTLAIPPAADMETEVQQLTSAAGAEAVMALPAIKLFKIGAYFAMNRDSQLGTSVQSGSILQRELKLTETDRLIISEIQQDLSLVSSPFTRMAARLGMDVEDFLAQCQALKQRGIVRRFSASVNHYKAGFAANAMTCWVAPPDAVEVAGKELATLREVSHCYERKTNPMWPYNLFAMIHCHTREACQSLVSEVSKRIGLMDCVLLFSTREFKKTRVKYLV